MDALVIGIKRTRFRGNDKEADSANQTFKAVRKKALEAQDYRCYRCGFKSASNEVHHLDDDHHNNSPKNLKVACQLCHPYSHVGEATRPVKLEAEKDGRIPAKAMAITRVPNELKGVITPENMHHLFRAIALALNSEKEAAQAKRLYAMLASKEEIQAFAQAVYGEQTSITSIHPSDIAAGMNYLTDDEYRQRTPHIEDVRVLYHPQYLKQVGSRIAAEQPALSNPTHWPQTLESALSKVIEALSSADIEQSNDSTGQDDE